MAAPAYATNLTTFWLESATTVTAIGTGGAGLGNPETDFFIQGSGCISKSAWTNAVKGFIIDALGTTFTVPTDGCVIAFIKYDAAGSLDTKAGGGLRMIIGSSSSAYVEFYIGGSDTLEFDSWVPYVIDPNTATPDVSGSGGSERWVGLLADLPTTSGPTKGNPIAMDAIRYGRGDIEYTLGDVTPNGPATFDGAEGVGNVNGTRWGLLELQNGAYQTQGFHSIGISGTACRFVDADKVLFWRKQENNLTNDAISTGFNRVEIINSSTVCEWTNIIWSALGTRSRGTFVHTAGTCDLDVCQFFDWGTFDFLSTANLTDCVFSRCDTITAPASVMTGSQILESRVAADAGALVYNSATDPNGKLDGMTFSQGTNDHHAIDFGTSVTSDIQLTNIEFTGFDETSGEDQPGAALRFLATSGSLTCTLSGCTVGGAAASATNFFKDDAAGIAVTLAFDFITLQVTVLDATDDTPITTAHVQLLKDSDKSVLLSGAVNGSGVISTTISYDTDTDVVGWAREHNISGTDYTQQDFSGQYTSAGFFITIR